MKQLLKFHASWCSPCKQLSGVFKHVDFKDVQLKEVDIDQEADLAKQYNIRSVPTLVLLKDGEEIGRKTGVLMADQLEQFIHV